MSMQSRLGLAHGTRPAELMASLPPWWRALCLIACLLPVPDDCDHDEHDGDNPKDYLPDGIVFLLFWHGHRLTYSSVLRHH